MGRSILGVERRRFYPSIGHSQALCRLERGGTTSPLTISQAERTSDLRESSCEGQLTDISETKIELVAVEARKAGRVRF
jgi:hypothetical protein